jgi:hypothetical protein
MPEEMERRLKAEAKKKGPSFYSKKKGLLTEQGRAYVYGAMRKTGWKPEREKE